MIVFGVIIAVWLVRDAKSPIQTKGRQRCERPTGSVSENGPKGLMLMQSKPKDWLAKLLIIENDQVVMNIMRPVFLFIYRRLLGGKL
jgi:hypothetical protein